MHIAFPINVKLLAACNFLSSTEETRHYLRGVNLVARHGDLYLIATTGAGLLIARQSIEDTAINFENCIIPREFINDLKVKHRGVDVMPIELLGDDASGYQVTLTMPDSGKRMCRSIDGQFPKWEHVIPREINVGTGSINVHLLNDFTKAAKLLNGNSKTSPTFTPGAEGTGFVNLHADDYAIYGVAVSMRNEQAVTYRPWDWVLETPRETGSAA